MAKITPPPNFVQPAPDAVYRYFDKLVVWLEEPLSRNALAQLRKRCRKLRCEDRPAGFDPRYRQRLELYLPRLPALVLLSAHPGSVYVSYAEIALDWIFADEFERDDAFAYADHHLVKRYHRNQGIRLVEGTTRYTGPRKAANNIVMYADLPCRITGEAFCLHVEWRVRGRTALTSAGITGIHDLIRFDHTAFWQSRLLLFAIDDLNRLGRRHNNYFHGTRRRREWIECAGALSWNHDKRLGRILNTLADGKAQWIIDKFAPKFSLRGCLRSIDVSSLLPQLESGVDFL